MSVSVDPRDAVGEQIAGGSAQSPDDGIRWLAEVLGEVFRLGIALLSRRYPSIRRKDACPRCGHRG